MPQGQNAGTAQNAIAADDFVMLTAGACGAPIAVISLGGEHQQLLTAIGLTAEQTHAAMAFCEYTAAQPPSIVLLETARDRRFHENPLVVHKPHIAFYAGVALTAADGRVLGTLGVMDHRRRRLGKRQCAQLRALARRLSERLAHEANTGAAAGQSTAADRSVLEAMSAVGIVEASEDAIFSLDANGIITSWNPGAAKMFGYSRAMIIGESIGRLLPDDCRNEEARIIDAIRSGQRIAPYETVRRARDGRLLEVSVAGAPIKDSAGQIVGASRIIRDIRPMLERARQAERLERLYSALSQVNQTIVRKHTREEILHEACRILVDVAGFALAWIGWIDPESQEVKPVAICGDETGYVSRIHVYADERAEGRGPAGNAVRNEQYCVCNDALHDPSMRPWHAELEHAGLHAVAGFPIRENGRVQGVLTVYSQHAGFFREREISLLEESATDIGFALDNLARDLAAHEAQVAVEREQRFGDALREAMPGIFYAFDRELRIRRWNRQLEKVTGYAPEEIAQMRLLDFGPGADVPLIKKRFADVFAGGESTVIANLLAKDGSVHPYYFTGRHVQVDDFDGMVGVGIDISARLEAEQARKLSEERLRMIFEQAGMGIAIVDAADGRLTRANPKMADMLGYDPKELPGMSAESLFEPECDAARSRREGLLRGEIDNFVIERQFRRKDGRELWGALTSSLARDADGQPAFAICLLEDRTQQKQQENRIARLNRIHAVIGGIHSAMLRHSDHQGLLHEACHVAVAQGVFALAAAMEVDAGSTHLRLVAAQGLFADTADFVDVTRRALPVEHQLCQRALRSGRLSILNDLLADPAYQPIHEQLRQRGLRAGAAFPLVVADKVVSVFLLIAVEVDFFDAEEITLLEWLARDLSYALGHIETAQRLEQLTYYDTLTGLENTRSFHEHLRRLEETARSQNLNLWLCAIDLKHFALVNQRHGHWRGNRLLRKVGERLRKELGADCAIARISGDIFAAAGMSADEAGGDPRERVLATFAEPFHVDLHEIRLEAFAGIALYRFDAQSRSSTANLDHATTALKLAKSSGEPFVYFSETLHQNTVRKLDMEAQLRAALERGQFMLAYQPRVDLISGAINGAEALIRWHHPERGVIQPDDFIDAAEHTGLIVPIGEWVIDQICAQQAAWRAARVPIVPVAANVSSIQLERTDLLKLVRDALARYALDPQALELELTERAVIRDMAKSLRLLTHFREMGIGLALDDFGTGYSSLSYLKQLPFHRVKIDRSFITDVTKSAEDAAIARAIVAIARSLRLKAVAEGVETEAQFAYLSRHQCDEFQGSYFSPPVEAKAFESYLLDSRHIDVVRPTAEAGRTLLIVDDEQGIRASLSRLFRHDGYRILAADSGAQALELLALHPVQVVISDQRMPGMSGIELLDKIKEMYPDTTRIILSGYTDLDIVTESVNRGAVFRFLTKPWDDEWLREQVREAFRQRETATTH
ncbi:MAG: EAL domain-containing protein [Xanthomonadaceae bacterium]|nr:EAL domain-containing protein [Xanthomonadaceae bacterium]